MSMTTKQTAAAKQIPCQACRSAPVETTIESGESRNAFQVCGACAHRLRTFSLRPLEWYELAVIQGPSQFLLHEDFYDQDGTACQPEEDVVDADLFPAPTLEEVSGDVERLLDYARTRWSVERVVVEALGRHSKESVLRSLEMRVALNPNLEVKALAYEVCAEVLGVAAEEWIRAEWASFTPGVLDPLANASAACLPNDEGHGRVVNALAKIPSKELFREAGALSWFRSEANLDWIERNISDPLLDDWGRLASLSNLKWERIVKWLASGRPLSLVALDALIACWHYNSTVLERFAPKLIEAAPVNEMNAVLNQYLESDSAPRVRKTIALIVSNWEQICQPQADI